ncbi:MAG: M20 family metallopeptidase [Candidatus Ranarchaeia archaeon]|jgi:succinyl-diaminopimelate desuccinylase
MLDKIIETTQKHQNKIISFLQSLVRIPSITKDGPDGPYKDIVAILERKFQELGCKIQVLEGEPLKPNIVAKLEGTTNDYTLHWNGHLDVLPVTREEWTSDPFAAEISQGKMYGRGTIDMKGGFAAGIMAAEILQELKVELKGDLIFSGVIDEESGGVPGAGFLVRQHPELIRSNSAIIPEPTEMNTLVIANKGALWVDITTKGKATHSAYPHLGVNAITQMTRIIQALDEMAKSITQTHPLIAKYDAEASKTTLNIAQIDGGVKTNVVPDSCTLNIDMRPIPGESTQMYLEKINDIIQREQKKDAKLNATFEPKLQIEPTEIDASEEIVKITQKHAGDVLGSPPQIVGAPWFSDRHYLVEELKVPTLHYGPGKCGTERCGGADEYIEIEELLNLTAISALIFAELLQ